jgi:transposase
MIAAYCKKHVFAAMTFTDYCDSLLVETWFEKVLVPELKPNQVIILDNASFHRKAKLRELLEAVGCKLLALPPYSPDLNKIEHVWNTIKSIVKHNHDPALEFHDKVNQAFSSL